MEELDSEKLSSFNEDEEPKSVNSEETASKVESLGSKLLKDASGKDESFNISSDESYILVDEDGSSQDLKDLKKIREINEVLSASPVDLEKLRMLAESKGGFIEDELRKRAWPLLIDIKSAIPTECPDKETLENNAYYKQVVLDVNRTLKRFPPDIEEQRRTVLMDELIVLIARVLVEHSDLHYYQGYHEFAITFLLVMGEHEGHQLVERLSVTHLCEFMRESMDRTVYYLTYLYPILKRVNPSLHNFLLKSEVGTMFCLSWLITWYAHSLPRYKDVVRLYDFLLASPYLMPMYVAAAMVLHSEKDVMEGECDMAMQHYILSEIPKTIQVMDDIVIQAKKLYSLFPPDDAMAEEVKEILQRKAEEEKRQGRQRKSKELSRAGGATPTAWNALKYLPFALQLTTPKRTAIKIALFALAATVATSWYSYYTDSPYLISYLPWGWS